MSYVLENVGWMDRWFIISSFKVYKKKRRILSNSDYELHIIVIDYY